MKGSWPVEIPRKNDPTDPAKWHQRLASFGLDRFDGIGFTTFGEDVRPELVNSRMWLLKTDQAGRFWMGTGDDSVSRIVNGNTVKPVALLRGLCFEIVIQILQDQQGTLWFAQGDSYG